VRQNGFAYVQTSNGWIDPATHVQYTAIDCLMSDIITDLLTNVQYGLGFTSADLGSMTQYALYQRAQGFFFSPLLNQQSKGTEILDRWAQISNSWIYWDGTGFQFVPLGDATVTGNGVTYTPDLSPAYALDLDDYLSGSSAAGASAKAGKEPPLKVTIVSEFDAKNTTRLTITDRTIGYVSSPFEWKDQDLVDLYGVHDSGSVSGDDICCPAVGTLVCQLIGKRAAYIRRTYSWKSSCRLIRLLPGSIVTLTEPNIGLNAARVRIRKVSEQDDGSLEFEAEEMP
jgi:putative tail protein